MAQIYKEFVRLIENHTWELEITANTQRSKDLVSFYSRQWVKYESAARFMSHIFKYLDRRYVQRENAEGKKLHRTFDLMMHSWNDRVLKVVKERYSCSTIGDFESLSKQEAFDEEELQKVIDSIAALTRTSTPKWG